MAFMPNVILMPREATRVPQLRAVVNGWPATEHRLRSDIAENPQELGATITDHVTARPSELTLTGWVSDLTARGRSGPAAAWRALQRLHAISAIIRVATPWATYSTMVIYELTGPQEGGALVFTLKLREIQRTGVIRQSIGPSARGAAAQRTSEIVRGLIRPEAFVPGDLTPLPVFVDTFGGDTGIDPI